MRLAQLAAEAGCGVPDAAAVVEEFRRVDRSFLMPPPDQPLAKETVIDISHESLLRQWTRLRTCWIPDEERSAEYLRRALYLERNHHRGKGDLLAGRELQEILEWWRTRRPSAALVDRYVAHFPIIEDDAPSALANRLGRPLFATGVQPQQPTSDGKVLLTRIDQYLEASREAWGRIQAAGRRRKLLRRSVGIALWILAIAAIVPIAAYTLRLRAQVAEHDSDTTRQLAGGAVETLLSTDINELPRCINELSKYREWANQMLRDAVEKKDRSSSEWLNAALALLPDDASPLNGLTDRLLDCDLKSFPTIRDLLFDHRKQIEPRLWSVLEDEDAPEAKRFHAAWALAKYSQDARDGAAARWKPHAAFVADSMVHTSMQNLNDYELVVKALEPARRHLVDSLIAIFRHPRQPESRPIVASVLQNYASDLPETLADLVVESDPRSFEALFAALKSKPDAAELMVIRMGPMRPADPNGPMDEVVAARQANAAVALLRLGEPAQVWPRLVWTPDPLLRSEIIHRAALYGAPPDPIVKHLTAERDVTIRQALILALGEFDGKALSDAVRRPFVEKLLMYYLEDDDPGIHGCAEWLLRKWGHKDRLEEADPAIRGNGQVATRRWYVNRVGQTMVVIQPGRFQMGSPKSDDNRESNENPHDVVIDYSFAIAAHEVTNSEFRRLPRHTAWKKQLEEWVESKRIRQEQLEDPRFPAIGVSWYEATNYCNWLSEQDGIPENEWCYARNSEGTFAQGMRPCKNYLKLAGYRLPTEMEWEYACRAGTITSRYFGQGDTLLPKYAWFLTNSSGSTHPVGALKA